MKSFNYTVTVIIPIYNSEKYIKKCLMSLVNQTISKQEIEILAIDDGSADNSFRICQELALQYPYIKVFSKENEGVSATRNFGIQRASGKYIMYLDSDDMLQESTLKAVIDFFEEHDAEVDLVTYPEIRIINGKHGAPHYRFETLTQSGVYDLSLEKNAFASQTIMNICVKNKGVDNVLFDTSSSFHEDQKYCTEILMRTMKIGYCNQGAYIYVYQPESITKSFFYSYYLFETTISYWEQLFDQFTDHVPYYIQALYLNDIGWKIRQDILYPYHYDKGLFENAIGRIKKLLRCVDDSVLMKHPAIDNFHKYYLIGLKSSQNTRAYYGDSGIALIHNDKLIYSRSKIEIVLTSVNITPFEVCLNGYLKSPIFSFSDKPVLYAVIDHDSDNKVPIPLYTSAWSYYKSKIMTNTFWGFELKLKNQKNFFLNFLLKCLMEY